MIVPPSSRPPGDAASPSPRTPARRGPLADLVFAVVWTTGPDPALDGVVRLQAWRASGERGAWERFDRFTNPWPENGGENGRDADTATSSARLVREFGVTRAALESAPRAREVFGAWREFLGDGPIVTADSETFESWFEHLSGDLGSCPPVIGIADLAALFLPGRLASRRAELIGLFADAPARAHGPEHVRTALVELARRVHALDEGVLRLAMMGYARAWRHLIESDPRAAERLKLALALLDLPSAYAHGPELPFEIGTGPAGDGASSSHSPAPAAALVDGRLAPLARGDDDMEDVVDALEPRCTREIARWAATEDLPAELESPTPFEPTDRATLDAIFQVHLPKSFAESHATHEGPARSIYRGSQHEVARRVADTLGSGGLLLVHAPTGTGKTLAYLVPAMLWARRHGLRVGVATYTRALQEQAMDREVPRALAMLARAGIATGTRVCVLKGRENYVCWRALKSLVPDEDTAEAWLAWTMVTTFALTDVEGDLDRLPQRPPLPLDSTEPFARALATLVRGVRGQSACCTHRDDRDTCAAEVARKKAVKCHVVVVNQAFALARQEFFRHVVFDECEHLHEQAHSAWSRVIGFRDLRGVLARLRQPGRAHSRAVLDRLARLLIAGTPSGDSVERASEAWTRLRDSIDALEREIRRFEAWREETRRSRVDREEHSMLREYVTGDDAGEIVEARKEACAAGHAMEIAMANLVERIDQMPLRGVGSTRRAIDTVRADLNEVLEALESWIPLEEGAPRFRPRTFYDVERDVRGDTVLAARVLLPHEFLGRNYYPELKCGVFLSATTWLRDGFDAARTYLGLERAANPTEDEDRPPSLVRTFRAPDVFDYRRVLIAVPRDAPNVTDKDGFLDYVRRFVTYLGERTRGRMLVLFTNAQDTRKVGEETAGFFRARRIPLWFQNMEGTAKEELSDLFRATVDSVLLGVDTFWYGADFPGETLEYLVIVRLPYGVPDRYHHAQCAAIGTGAQRDQIYLPRALAKFRQGFGRLMRRESDKGCVFLLDHRVLDPRHRFFLRELPIERAFDVGTSRAAETTGARLVRGDTDHCLHEAFAHMSLLADVKRRGLDWSFGSAGRPLRGHGDEDDAAQAGPRSRARGVSRAGGDVAGVDGPPLDESTGEAPADVDGDAREGDGTSPPRRAASTSLGRVPAPPTPPPPARRREPPPEPFQVSSEDVPF